MANIYDMLIDDGRFNTLVAAIDRATLKEALTKSKTTLFAPTDDAFAKLPSGSVQSLLDDASELAKLLAYHILTDRHPSSELAGTDAAQTAEGSAVRIEANGHLRVNGVEAIATDIEADNGLIHIIDTVLIPPSISKG